MPRVVFCSPPTMTISMPWADSAAPITPKMSAWLEEVGSAATNVMRSQAMAAMSAATTMSCVTTVESTIPAPTVLATASPVSAPTKLRTPARRMACSGLRTRVATTVAMALAASWKPFTNSNATPRRTTRASSAVALSTTVFLREAVSAVLHDDGLDDVGDVLTPVDRNLHQGVDVLPFHDLDGVVGSGEQLSHGLPPDLVALVLERVDLDPVGLEPLAALEISHHEHHLPRGAHQHLRLADRAWAVRLDPEEVHELRHVVADVGDVVDLRSQADDVLAVEGRHEGLVEMLDDLGVELVAVVLDRVDVADLDLDLGKVSEELLERLGRLERVLGVLFEKSEELALLGHQR